MNSHSLNDRSVRGEIMTIQDRREREKLENRKIILESAKQVFAQKGFHAATMEEISELAEFSKGAIYNYFENKETLFVELINEKLNDIIKIIKENVPKMENPEAKIIKMTELILNFFEDEKETFRIIQTVRFKYDSGEKNKLHNTIHQKYVEYYNFIINVIKEGISAGLLKNIDPQLLSMQLIGLIHQIIAFRILGEIKYNIKKLADFAMLLFFEGAKK